MKNICIIDKLNNYKESFITDLEVDIYKLSRIFDQWEKISTGEFKIISSKKNMFKYIYDLNNIDGVFDKNQNIIRLCIKDSNCSYKTINDKEIIVFAEIKEYEINILSKIIDCKDHVICETVCAEILNVKNIDNNTL